ncbi:ECF RNA polymerase sigma-E factor [bioreactor metagenome]|uniref:ECF RNA polymerase sigma-E factor n=1 Tax=bioreactor metagenome TaxID=1076179 RepID=A0A644V153_9ZZZZ|nr:sigma-70 family RNA polymerase sigma factor [Desulfovibrio desulfuricans]MBD8895092.1 sigma-70 family RNA polymerase sigma factor [Desulfovibrio desulfuricans]MEA4992017.1 sigma-70 family RNA polymerase sigma factor [Desulfovibrio desulfuricans]
MAHLPKSIPKEIFRKCYQHLKTFLQKKLPQNDVEDVIQTAFYKLVKADQLLLPQDEMLAWLYHVARNASIDLLKKKKTISAGDCGPQDQEEFSGNPLELLLLDDARPEDHVLKNLFWEEFESALTDLPEEQRNIFVRTELLGESYNSISSETGVPVNTLISRKHYAVLRLRTRLESIRQEIINS